MRGGSKKGERRGGRQKGTPNKVTAERERRRLLAIYEADKLGVVAPPNPIARYLARDVLSETMTLFRIIAFKYSEGQPLADEDKHAAFLKLAAEVAKDLAPYESPRLSTTTLRTDPQAPPRVHVIFGPAAPLIEGEVVSRDK